jgi:membrane fusion protein (multidrug efflux system)
MSFFQKYPIATSAILLVALLAVILIGDRFRAPQENAQTTPSVAKSVNIFSFDEPPTIVVSGKVDDTSSIVIKAQTSGIVSSVSVVPGQSVYRGTTLLSLSDTYLGGSTATTQRQLAERGVEFQQENENRRTDIAETQERNLTPQTDDDLARITRAQYRLQGSQVAFDIDTATLQAQQARINESRFYPTSPLTGTVERIFPHTGDTVSAGEPLAVIRGQGQLLATAILPQHIASSIDIDGQHFLVSKGEHIAITPQYLSQTATDGTAYSLTFSLPETLRDRINGGEFASLRIAMTIDDEQSLLVPLDAITFSGETAFVFVEEDGIAREREVQVGAIVGSFVRILSGVTSNDRVIVNRSISDGDTITPTNYE